MPEVTGERVQLGFGRSRERVLGGGSSDCVEQRVVRRRDRSPQIGVARLSLACLIGNELVGEAKQPPRSDRPPHGLAIREQSILVCLLLLVLR